MRQPKLTIALCIVGLTAIGCGKDSKKKPGQGGPPPAAGPQGPGPTGGPQPGQPAAGQPGANPATAQPGTPAAQPAQPGTPTTPPAGQPAVKPATPPAQPATAGTPAKPATPPTAAPPTPGAKPATPPTAAPAKPLDPKQAARAKTAEEKRKQMEARRNRIQEIYKLGRSDKPEDEVKLIALIKSSKEVYERASAIRALGRKKRANAVPELKSLVDVKDTAVKIEATIKLYQWGEKGFALPILKKLRDQGVALRRAFQVAYENGRPTYDKNALAFFKQGTKNDNVYVRLDSAIGLIELGKEKAGVPLVKTVLEKEERFHLRMAAVNYMSPLKANPSVKKLLELATKDKDERVAKRARDVLKIAAPTAKPGAKVAPPSGKPVPPGAAPDATCRDSKSCKWGGRCTSKDGQCVAAVAADCKDSDGCKVSGMCTLKAGGCVVGTTADCAQSKACAITGYCSLSAGKCLAVSDADCKKSSLCKKNGACTARDGKCLKK